MSSFAQKYRDYFNSAQILDDYYISEDLAKYYYIYDQDYDGNLSARYYDGNI